VNAQESNLTIRAKWEIGTPYKVPSFVYQGGQWQRFDYKYGATIYHAET